MILRNFLFLDTATMADYLSTLEGFVLEGTVDQTEVEKTGRAGKAGYKIIEGSAASETSTETKQRLAATDAGTFQKLYELLDKRGLVQFLDAFDADIWSQLRRGELVEVQASIRLPESFLLTQVLEEVHPFLDIMAALGQEPIDPSQRTTLEAFQAVVKLTEKQAIPLAFEAASSPGFHFVAHLPRQYLRCQLADLQGEAIVLGKIQRVLQKRQSVEVFSLMPAFTSLAFDRRQRRKMQKDMATKKVADVVSGPAIVLAPLAVYR